MKYKTKMKNFPTKQVNLFEGGWVAPLPLPSQGYRMLAAMNGRRHDVTDQLTAAVRIHQVSRELQKQSNYWTRRTSEHCTAAMTWRDDGLSSLRAAVVWHVASSSSSSSSNLCPSSPASSFKPKLHLLRSDVEWLLCATSPQQIEIVKLAPEPVRPAAVMQLLFLDASSKHF